MLHYRRWWRRRRHSHPNGAAAKTVVVGIAVSETTVAHQRFGPPFSRRMVVVVVFGGSMEEVLPVVFAHMITVFFAVMLTISRVRRRDILNTDASDLLYAGHLSALIVCVERQTDSLSSRTACPSRSMDVGFDVLRRLQLDHQVNLGDVEAARSYVRSYDTSNTTLLEVFEDVLASALRNVPVENFRSLAQRSPRANIVGFSLGLRENNRAAVLPAVIVDHVGNSGFAIAVRTADCQVLDALGRLQFAVLHEVDEFAVIGQVFLRQVVHPARNGRRKQQVLGLSVGVLAHILEDLLDVLLEALSQHLIRLVKAHDAQVVQPDDASLQQVEQATGSRNDDVGPSLDFADLVSHVRPAVHRHH